MNRIAIIEDNEEEAERLKRCIERYGAAQNQNFSIVVIKSAMEFLSQGGTYSLVFFDIDLPGINGLEAAQLMRSYDPVTPIIFVTNLAQYAMKGYEVNALDFIVKPVTYYDFALRMEKAMRAIERLSKRSIFVKTVDNGIHVVPINNLAYVEVLGHNLLYHLADKNEALHTRGTLGALETGMSKTSLVRVSNSHIVNADYIRSIQGNDIIMSTGEVIGFSRSRKTAALKAIADYLGGAF